MKQAIGVKLCGAQLVGHIVFQARHDIALEDLEHSRIDRLAHHEKRLAVHGIDPIVRGRAQAQPLARDIVLGQLPGSAVVNPNVAVNIEDRRLLGRRHHPLLAKPCAP